MDEQVKSPKMVAVLVDPNRMRSPRHGVYEWADLPIGTPFFNRLRQQGNEMWDEKRASHSFAGAVLVEADPPAPDLTVTLPPKLVDWICTSFFHTDAGQDLQKIVQAAKDAQEA